MDLPSAYWDIPMEETSIQKTAFEIPKGRYEMLRMPYGLKNLQRYIDSVLKSGPNTNAYVDNILIDNRSFTEHIYSL